ncbi:MAG TPA: response regulator transcription factor [Roseiarcus sp.]|nr:response regulator transcription factor [Roseiarcus sp.]
MLAKNWGLKMESGTIRAYTDRSGGNDIPNDFERSGSPEVRVWGQIVLIEGRKFLSECIRKSLEEAFPLRVVAHSTVPEFTRLPRVDWPRLVLVSLIGGAHEVRETLEKVSALAAAVPVIVLASQNDAQLARSIMQQGAKGYIPVTLGFDLAVEAVRFVLAGGTYVPVECFASTESVVPASQPFACLSSRELAVVRAIQQGKPNKIIAYELGMCESTVKVHVRNVMKKLKAKNRTEVAVKAQAA